ncbi:unnamed protein product [Urochloa decumbens]|uniref:Uncharacterized protein n=1 Tax=Urochloa decumbens TaxID=240449 RepID=A0ABC9CFY9_9POAL
MAFDNCGQWQNGQEENVQDNRGLIGPFSQPVAEGPLLNPNDQILPRGEANIPDLNEPVEEDLGAIENLAQDNDAPPLQPVPVDQVQIIDGGEPSDEAMEQPAALPDLSEANQIDVFIPLDNGVPLQVMPDEVMEEDLLGSQGSQGDHQSSSSNNSESAGNNVYQHNIQLGRVQLLQPDYDPVFTARMLHSQPPMSKQHAAAIRAWAQFLAPGLGAPSTAVPKPWADFFTALLLNPSNFQWAKNLLSSTAWDFFYNSDLPSVQFALPDHCLKGVNSFCLDKVPFAKIDDITEEEHRVSAEMEMGSPLEQPHPTVNLPDMTLVSEKGKKIVSEILSPCTPPEKRGQRISPSTGPWSKALLAQAAEQKKAGGLVDTYLRRNDRKKRAHKGFKNHTCLDKECLGCSSKPLIPTSLIKNLGASFCKVDPAKLTEEALGKKRKAAAPGGKKPVIKKPSKTKEDEDESKAKKDANKKQPKK